METNQAAHDAAHSQTVGPAARKRLWKVFWLLLAITLVEVALAFTHINKDLLNTVFFAFTIVKAYYIVGYFMHLKTERSELAWILLLPFVLLLYFIFMALYEGTAFHHVLFGS